MNAFSKKRLGFDLMLFLLSLGLHLSLFFVLGRASVGGQASSASQKNLKTNIQIKTIGSSKAGAMAKANTGPRSNVAKTMPTVRPVNAKKNLRVKEPANRPSSPSGATKNSDTGLPRTVAGTSPKGGSGLSMSGSKPGSSTVRRDLSRPEPLLIACQKPALTDEALDAGLQGPFGLEVFVGKDGGVKKVDLEKKIGYGMDQVLRKAGLSCRFRPALHPSGKPYATWGGVTIRVLEP